MPAEQALFYSVSNPDLNELPDHFSSLPIWADRSGVRLPSTEVIATPSILRSKLPLAEIGPL
jgi:hypothetical protein